MHDVLDPRDLVPDEVEQRLHTGYPVGDLLARARAAAAADDLAELSRISSTLDQVPRDPAWHYDEPDGDDAFGALLSGAPEAPVPPRAVTDRIHGAWLGRCVGNTMGKPVEGLRPDEVKVYLEAVGQWPQTGYLPLLEELPPGVSHLHESAPFATAGNFTDVPRDDDIDWTILALLMVEEHGTGLTTGHVATTWLDRLPFTQTFTAERVAYRNLIRGVPAERAAVVENPYREWIGALIRGDLHGMIRPGCPRAAARAALPDARLSHVGNGVYGELWAAALLAAALDSDSTEQALRRSLAVVPTTSRLYEAVATLLVLHASGVDVTEAHRWVDQHLGHYNWVHTVNNAALITLGLLWGTDFVDAVAKTVAGGRDTDSTAATVGAVLGAVHGTEAVPEHLVGTTHIHVRSAVRDMDRVTITELAVRTVTLAEALL